MKTQRVRIPAPDFSENGDWIRTEIAKAIQAERDDLESSLIRLKRKISERDSAIIDLAKQRDELLAAANTLCFEVTLSYGKDNRALCHRYPRIETARANVQNIRAKILNAERGNK